MTAMSDKASAAFFARDLGLFAVVRRVVFALMTGMSALAQPGEASLLPVDLFAAGDALLTRDTETGLEWLDLTPTAGLSYDDVAGGAGGWIAMGFRVARQSQVNTLYLNAGIDTVVSTINGTAVDTLLTLMGCTRGDCSDPGAFAGAAGLADLDSFDPTTAVEMFLESFPNPDDPSGRLGQASLIGGDVFGFLFLKDVATPGLGVYLYRGVPEPATIVLFALGLALVARGSRRTWLA